MARLLNIKMRKPAECEKRSINVITLNIAQGEMLDRDSCFTCNIYPFWKENKLSLYHSLHFNNRRRQSSSTTSSSISSCNSLSFKRAPLVAGIKTASPRVNGKNLHARLTGFSRSLLFNLSLSTSTYVTLSRVLKSIRLSLCLRLIIM